MEDPSTAFMILQKLGFELNNNCRRLIYKRSRRTNATLTSTLLEIKSLYTMYNISPRLFDLACNQLMLKTIAINCKSNIDSAKISIGQYQHTKQRTKQRAIFTHSLSIASNPNTNSAKKHFESLINALLQLPNQYHVCYFSSSTFNLGIYILNNSGEEYEDIDWVNMDFNDLMNDKNIRPIIIQTLWNLTNPYVIKHCLKNGEYIFVKKIIYFAKKFFNELDIWPNSIQEYIMMQVRRHRRIVDKGSSYYFIEIIEKRILPYVYNKCCRGNNIHKILSIFSAAVDQFVENVVKPTINSSKIIEQKKKAVESKLENQQWTCFICQSKNIITSRSCTNCLKNVALVTMELKSGAVSMNPYFPLDYKKSLLEFFNIDKPFGLLFATDNEARCEYQNKENAVINVLCRIEKHSKFCVLFDKDNSLTVGELKSIINDVRKKWSRDETYNELVHSCFKSSHCFGKMCENVIIPQKTNRQPYLVDVIKDMVLFSKTRKDYIIHFGNKHYQYQCPDMIRAKLANKKNNDDSNSKNDDVEIDHDLFKRCPYIEGEYDDDSTSVYDHLSRFDHFESFGIKQPHCKYGIKCKEYQLILNRIRNNCNNSDQDNITDERIFKAKKHLYIEYHPPFLVRNNLNFRVDGVDHDEQQRSYACYDYIPKYLIANKHLNKRRDMYGNRIDNSGICEILNLLQEVIKNNFIKDLFPKTDINPLNDDKKYILEKIRSKKSEYMTFTSRSNNQSYTDQFTQLKKFFSDTFGIFDKVQDKMKSSRIIRGGGKRLPIKDWQIFALILYCDGQCNYALSESQRNGTCDVKWPVFDCLLNLTIYHLSQFEEHWENIYTGLCGVFHKFNNNNTNNNSSYNYKNVDVVHLTTNVSFTTDLNIAKQFRGSSGMIIGLNMKRSYAATLGLFHAIDVSWVSKHLGEKEILCARGSQIHFYKNKMTEIQTKHGEKQQWFVCDEGNYQETSFETMFNQAK